MSSLTGEPLDQLKYYRDEAQFAIQQLNSRVSAYLTSQSFLLITYGSAFNNGNEDWGDLFTLVMPLILSVMGLALTATIRPGILASLEVIHGWHERQRALIREYPALHRFNLNVGKQGGDALEMTEDSASHRRSIQYAPMVLGIMLLTWVVLAGLAVYLHLYR